MQGFSLDEAVVKFRLQAIEQFPAEVNIAAWVAIPKSLSFFGIEDLEVTLVVTGPERNPRAGGSTLKPAVRR